MAREMGLSAQALYHCFDSRDAFLAALIADDFQEAATAIAAGRDSGGDDGRERLRGAALAYRQWAVSAPHVYRLLCSDFLLESRVHEDPPASATGVLPGIELAEAVFEGWAPPQFASLDSALGGPGDEPAGDGFGALPEAIRSLLARWWASCTA